MASYPDHIYELRRTHPDIHGHFVKIFLPLVVKALPDIIQQAKIEAPEAGITPIIEAQNQPWPVCWAESDHYLTHSDYKLMVKVEEIITSLRCSHAALVTYNHSPTLTSRRNKPYTRISFQLAPKIKSYQ